ncbi:MAG: phosphotransferase, partial [Anaerolineae bacterium]|nr:phosphotransferase [Anaerolineae bacterium]
MTTIANGFLSIRFTRSFVSPAASPQYNPPAHGLHCFSAPRSIIIHPSIVNRSTGMTFNRSRFQIDQHTLQRIWDAHALGQITSVDWAGTGMNNPALLINNTHVIRFDGIINDGISRFHGERRAYDLLNQAAIPAPHVLLLDDTKTLVPNDFMVMTKVEGQPLIDSWPRLTPPQRQQAAAQAGEILARLHAITLDQFGRLYGTQGVFSTWFAYLIDKLTNYGQQAVTGHFITPAVYDRMQAVFHAHRPLLDTVTTPHLIHWDYHFGNL